MAVETRKLLLILTVEVSIGRTESIYIYEGDKPHDIATLFIRNHALASDTYHTLVSHLETNLSRLRNEEYTDDSHKSESLEESSGRDSFRYFEGESEKQMSEKRPTRLTKLRRKRPINNVVFERLHAQGTQRHWDREAVKNQTNNCAVPPTKPKNVIAWDIGERKGEIYDRLFTLGERLRSAKDEAAEKRTNARDEIKDWYCSNCCARNAATVNYCSSVVKGGLVRTKNNSGVDITICGHPMPIVLFEPRLKFYV
jgi:hypothetical protein